MFAVEDLLIDVTPTTNLFDYEDVELPLTDWYTLLRKIVTQKSPAQVFMLPTLQLDTIIQVSTPTTQEISLPFGDWLTEHFFPGLASSLDHVRRAANEKLSEQRDFWLLEILGLPGPGLSQSQIEAILTTLQQQHVIICRLSLENSKLSVTEIVNLLPILKNLQVATLSLVGNPILPALSSTDQQSSSTKDAKALRDLTKLVSYPFENVLVSVNQDSNLTALARIVFAIAPKMKCQLRFETKDRETVTQMTQIKLTRDTLVVTTSGRKQAHEAITAFLFNLWDDDVNSCITGVTFQFKNLSRGDIFFLATLITSHKSSHGARNNIARTISIDIDSKDLKKDEQARWTSNLDDMLKPQKAALVAVASHPGSVFSIMSTLHDTQPPIKNPNIERKFEPAPQFSQAYLKQLEIIRATIFGGQKPTGFDNSRTPMMPCDALREFSPTPFVQS